MEPLGKKYDSTSLYVKWYAIALTILLFSAYPIALFIPHGHGFNVFDFFFPSFLAATGISAAFLLLIHREGKFCGYEICSLLFVVFTLVSSLVNSSASIECLKYIGVGIIPLAVALAYRQCREVLIKCILWGGALLWLINVIHCYHKLPNISFQGLAGNRNWLSALVIATIPLTGALLKRFLAKKVKSEALAMIIANLIPLIISIPIIIKADSRASFVALILLPLFLCFIYFGKKVKIGLSVAVLTGAILAPIIFKDALARENKRNVRVSMWQATGDMIIDNPLGVGPGNFEYVFPRYVQESQKRMLVSAETTMHPHNEFFHMMTVAGIPGGLCWLILIIGVLFSNVKDDEDALFKTAMFILLIQGFMDKPLFQMPTMLLFYVLTGAVWGAFGLKAFSLKIPEKEKRNLYKIVAAVIILAFGYFTVVSTVSSWRERQALIAEAKGDKKRALEYFTSSHEIAPWRLFPAYKAFIITTVDSPDPLKAIDFYEVIEAKAPDLRQFNLLKGKFFTQLAMQDREMTRQHLEAAWKSYNRACELNVTNILSYVDRFKFAASYLGEAEMQKSYEELQDLYTEKANSVSVEIRKDLNVWAKEWKSLEKYSELAKEARIFTSRMKPAYVYSSLYPADMGSIIGAFHGSFQISDMVFAFDSLKLHNSFKDDSLKIAIERVFSEVEEDIKVPFSWPLETWKNKKGNRKSVLALASMVARVKGNEAFIFQKGTSFELCILSAEGIYISTRGNLIEVDMQKLQQVLKGSTVIYFNYPQAFFYKNEMMSAVVSEAGVFPDYCRNPDFGVRIFIKKFPRGHFRFEIMKEPFQDILKRMQGQ